LICSVPLIQAGVDPRLSAEKRARAAAGQAHAERRQQRLERPAVEKADDRPLEDHARGAGDEEGGGDGDQDRSFDVLRHHQLHDIGGVGAQHHQFAVRHVDDAHHAEGNRQPNRDQHQHRSEAEAEEERLDAGVERARLIDAAHRFGCGASDVGVALGETAVRRRLEQGGQPVAHFGPSPMRERRNRIQTRFRIAAVQRGERQTGLDFRLDAGVGFDANPLPQQRDARVVERAHHFGHGGEPHRGIRTR
jgi:hypothetical protein